MPFIPYPEEDGIIVYTLNNHYPYRSLEPEKIMGEGHFGVVEHVIDNQGQGVAIKTVTLNPKDFRAFFPEILSYRLTGLPNVVTPTNFSWYKNPEIENTIEFTFEYPLYDGNLKELFERRFAGRYRDTVVKRIELAIEIFDRLIESVYQLAYNGVYHYDIKPENILYKIHNPIDSLNLDFEIAIADFGISKQGPCFQVPNRDFRRANVGGTRIYFPPEQVEKNIYLSSSMFYNVALTVYYLLVGNYSSFDTFSRQKYDDRIDLQLNFLHRYCTDEQKGKITTVLELINSEPVYREGFIPPHRTNLIQIQPPADYASAAEVVNRLVAYEREVGQPARDFSIERAATIFSLNVWKKTVERFVDVDRRPFQLGFIQYIGVMDCLSRYLKKYPYIPFLEDIIIALFRVEVFGIELLVPNLEIKDLVELAILVLDRLDYRLFDCQMTLNFFCLKNVGKFDLVGLAQDLGGLPDLFENPPQKILQLVVDSYPQLSKSCFEKIGYENLIYPPEHYLRL